MKIDLTSFKTLTVYKEVPRVEVICSNLIHSFFYCSAERKTASLTNQIQKQLRCSTESCRHYHLHTDAIGVGSLMIRTSVKANKPQSRLTRAINSRSGKYLNSFNL